MGSVNEKSTARAGSVARDRLVRALLQSAFEQGPQPLSLAQAAQLADLSRPAVVASKDQLREVLAPDDGASQAIALEPALGAAIGVEIRQDEVTVLLSDLAGQPLVEPKQETKSLEEDPRDTLERAADLIGEALRETGRSSGDVVGVGLSLAHPVDPRQNGIVRALNTIEDHAWRPWEGMGDVRQQLRQRLRWSDPAPGLESFLADNDANLSTLGESHWGSLRGTRHALYLHWADGIGSGLIVGGELDRGVGGVAGAIGHMSVSDNPGAERCPRCGLTGCLEMTASGRAILSSLGRSYSVAAIDELVVEAADRDSAARRALQAGAFQLGRVLGTCLHVLNPEAIVIGGAFGHAVFDLVRNDGLEEGLRHQAVPAALDDVNVGGIHQSRFRAHSAVRGAVTRVLWELLPAFLGRKAELLT
jgi:predicted NBD/HSP70 family sugar kinase